MTARRHAPPHKPIEDAPLTAMGSLAASITHEINQPIASIVAYSDAALRWLDRPQPDLAEVSRNLQGIREAGRRAGDIVKALRALVMQAPSSLSPVEIEDIADDVLRLLAPEISAAKVTLLVDFAAHRRSIMGDRVQLHQVLFNLITNALHAMTETQRTERRLRVATSTTGSGVQLTVEDTGCGMTPEVLARIFQPFFTTKAGGMGIGLAICRSIAELHDGSLNATSAEGRGSAFCLRLPHSRL